MDYYKKIFREEILNTERYINEYNNRFDHCRLDKNERLSVFRKKSLNDFKKRLKSENLSAYSELSGTYRRLSEYLGINSDQLLLCAGSDMGIRFLFDSCGEKKSNIVLHDPCFAMYKVYAKLYGVETRVERVGKNWSYSIEAMMNRVDEKTKFMVIERPNGFIDASVSEEETHHSAKYLEKKGALLVLDEAYFLFRNNPESSNNLLKEHNNIIILRTFSKSHGLAGERIGYIMSNAVIMKNIKKVIPMHEISSIASLCVTWILDHPKETERYLHETNNNMKYVTEKLKKLGLDCRSTQGNFFLIKCDSKIKAQKIRQHLKNHRILVRRPFQEDTFDHFWLRITVGTRKQMNKLVNVIKVITDQWE